ncbi:MULTISPECIES: MarR family winged helix-turn-helix transcriptional regulator [Erythrobacter]|uniref:MarR family winged helix-turn-helix transcriptional regulator n=1 Tax=Erythrobacter TaxID=1041 RepID=UPI000C891180|nr:MarR family winged helix-turn-helix transcriptional regulator [Erythrobacter sp. SN021]MAU08511.1 MarR family transcriptional regulator [Anaerolineaceae bacterium]MCF8882588.1 MarR family winged helix-turn-helix transcriptional regulator [Erythrobacter sp. SN021]
MDAFRSGNPRTPAFRVKRYPFYLLTRLISRYNTIIDARLRAIDLDIPSWRVLMILGEKSPRSARDIADTAVINLSTMTRIMQRMITAGLITKTQSETDARVSMVALAPEGEERLATARQVTAPIYEHLVEGLTADEFEQLVALLNRLHDNLEPLAI